MRQTIEYQLIYHREVCGRLFTAQNKRFIVDMAGQVDLTFCKVTVYQVWWNEDVMIAIFQGNNLQSMVKCRM